MAPTARLAQSAERKALNLVVVGSSPTVGVSPMQMLYLEIILLLRHMLETVCSNPTADICICGDHIW